MTAVSSLGKSAILALSCVLLSCRQSPDTIPANAFASDPELKRFYEARAWQAAWDRKSERALRETLDQSPAHGLRPEMFLKGELPRDGSERDAALTKVALAYSAALARGYTDPAKLAKVYTIPRARADVAGGLAQALQQGRLREWLDSLAPQTAEYRAVSQAYLKYLSAVAATHPQVPLVQPGKVLKPGQRDSRVPAIAGALAANRYVEPASVQPPRYSGILVEGVKRLQADFGLKADGVIGPDTVDALNTGPADRARQLAVALERLRWLERNPPPTRIDVNTGAAFLEYWRNGRQRDRRNVVVGQPGWETPQLQSPIFQLVAHPWWRLPDSIVKDELLKKGPGYFAAQGIAMRDGRYMQRPGAKNALGMVKLDMRNDEAIYLHDTPAKALFAQSERHRSHGCVRVENALQFAMMLASEDGLAGKFREALAKGEESFVKLKTEIPVRLLYHTAFFDGSKVQLRPDVYRWDDAVAAALGLGRVRERPPFQTQTGDIGP